MIVYRPLSKWSQPEVVPRPSAFKAGWDTTMMELQREVDMLDGDPWSAELVIEVDVTEREITVHDRLHGQARPMSPRVAVSFDSRHGPLRYECGTFDSWRANVRAIAKGLNALRDVDRWGMAGRGEQYTGWKAIGSGIAMPAAQMTVEQAARALVETAFPGSSWDERRATCDAVISDVEVRALIWRQAVRFTHPDKGGDPVEFDRAQKAYDLINNQQGANT